MVNNTPNEITTIPWQMLLLLQEEWVASTDLVDPILKNTACESSRPAANHSTLSPLNNNLR